MKNVFAVIYRAAIGLLAIAVIGIFACLYGLAMHKLAVASQSPIMTGGLLAILTALFVLKPALKLSVALWEGAMHLANEQIESF